MPRWLIPMVYTVLSCLLVLTLPRFETHYFGTLNVAMSVGSATAFFSTIAGGMLALASMVFAIAFVMVQFSAVAYSPRLVIMYANRPIIYHALGLFFATFIFAVGMITRVDHGGSGQVPYISAWVVISLTIASLLVFAMLIQNFSDLQIHNVLSDVGRRGRIVIRDLYGMVQEGAQATSAPPETALLYAGQVQTLTYAGDPRSIAQIDIDGLVALAAGANALIRLECAVGDTLVVDTVVLRVYGATHVVPEAALMRAIRRATARTFEQDPKYAIRLLVDIAIRALSPAINDPTTAVQALDQIEDLLRRLGRRELGQGRIVDSTGTLRLIFPLPDWSDYLSLSFDEIRQFGDNSVQVLRRLRSALIGLSESVATEERRMEVRRYIDHLEQSVGRSGLDDQDKHCASQEDRQGLGLSRRTIIAAAPSPGGVEPRPV